MERLSAEGVRGADLVFACIGPAMELYSRYSKVEDAEGRRIPLYRCVRISRRPNWSGVAHLVMYVLIGNHGLFAGELQKQKAFFAADGLTLEAAFVGALALYDPSSALPSRLLGTQSPGLCFGVVLMAAVWLVGFAPAICLGCAQWAEQGKTLITYSILSLRKTCALTLWRHELLMNWRLVQSQHDLRPDPVAASHRANQCLLAMDYFDAGSGWQ